MSGTRRHLSSTSEPPVAALSALGTTLSTSKTRDGSKLNKSAKVTASTCHHCGRPAAGKKFCTTKCYQDHRQKVVLEQNTKPCLKCGTPIYRTPAHWKRMPSGGYCSHQCASSGDTNAMWTGGPVTLTCPRCQTQFTRQKAEAKRAKWCSPTCASLSIWDQSGRRLQEIPCAECGKVFKPVSRKSTMCSQACAAKRQSKFLRGEANGRYVHGDHQRPYPAGWTRNFKASIRERDGNSCQVCMVSVPSLHVHHINYIKEDLEPLNLITVCKHCHGSMHGSLQSRQEWSAKLSSLLRSRLGL